MATRTKAPSLLHLAPASLVMNKQVRTEFNEKADAELLESVKVSGVMTPIQVRAVGDAYHVIAGHRRTAAAIAAGLETVPAYVRDVLEHDIIADQLVENIQRENMTLGDIARGLTAMHSAPGGGLASQVAKRLGKSPSWVSKMLLVGREGDHSVAGKLIRDDKVSDLELAYLLCKLEAKNAVAAQEVADNIENETRATVKRRLAEAKKLEADGGDGEGEGEGEGEDEDYAPLWQFILKTLKAATVAKRDEVLREAAVELIEAQLEE